MWCSSSSLTDLSIAPELSLCLFLLCNPQGCIKITLCEILPVFLVPKGWKEIHCLAPVLQPRRAKRTKVTLVSQLYHTKMWGFFIWTLKAAILCSMLVHSRLIVQIAFGTDLPSDLSIVWRPETTCTFTMMFIHCSIHLLSYLAG